MTADLRRTHRRTWLALLIVLPLLFYIARFR